MSLHADALAVVAGWTAPGQRQEALRAEIATHLGTHPTGVWRTCFPDHLTAGTIVLSDDAEHVLLNLHGKARRWFAFGGHCEEGDVTLAAVARREALEESGLPAEMLRFDETPVHMDIHTVDFCDPRGPVRHLDVRFVATVPATTAHRASEESLDVRWWPLAALPELGDEMLDLIDHARRRVQSASVGSSSRAADQPSR
ncbi:NUDIX hydrolase [Nocardioides alcanivorans]|uniref:NUDIX hydrolase n=1 Tax=Nocardioides alcanivorans TaxID=2897352 RepID=UPI001F304B4A|nr:NUDIX domain-containing protein [Nocardioides alcanivorans]